MTIEWTDEKLEDTGNAKFPQLFAAIKAEQLASSVHRTQWAKVQTYANGPSGRDAAHRLGKTYTEFDVVSRVNDDGSVTVYARLKEGIGERPDTRTRRR